MQVQLEQFLTSLLAPLNELLYGGKNIVWNGYIA